MYVLPTTWKTAASWPVVRTIWGWWPDRRKKPWADTVQPPLQWGGWERTSTLASDTDTGESHREGPAVSVSSSVTRHLPRVSYSCKTKAWICLRPSTNPPSRYLYLLLGEETFKSSNLAEVTLTKSDAETIPDCMNVYAFKVVAANC